jgi:C4-dicarboxylate-specific signal transduction histidine kinase
MNAVGTVAVGSPTIGSGDRVQLQQVGLNLIMNGSEAMSGVEQRPQGLVITMSPKTAQAEASA